MRPSPLYRRLGLTGTPLLTANVGAHALGDRVYSLTIARGGTGLSEHTAATLTVETPENVDLGGQLGVQVTLTAAAATQLAATSYTTPEKIQDRFRGRIGTRTAHDKTGWRGTTVTAAAWSSILGHAPDTWTPWAGASLAQAAVALFQPAWEPRQTYEWFGTDLADTWHEAADPITAADLLTTLTDRLHFLADRRDGVLQIKTLPALEAAAATAASYTWPLARAHCLSPTVWEQPSTYVTEYRLLFRTPTGTAEIYTGEAPSGTARTVTLDWTDFVSRSEHWRRVYGLRWDSFQTSWRLPTVTVRLDHLLSSPYESHRRAAGMLLDLDVGDPIPLADDWPGQVRGVHIVTGIEEKITHQEWTLTLSLVPYRSLAGQPQLPVKPRTWDQAGPRTWDSSHPATWNQGVPA